MIYVGTMQHKPRASERGRLRGAGYHNCYRQTMAGQSGAPAPAQSAMTDYVTKDDMKSMEERIMAAFNEHRGRSETGANIPQQQKGGANR